MRQTILSFALLAALAGCSVVPPQAWTFDPTHPQPKPVADSGRIVPLTNSIAQLQLQLDEVRGKIATEPDAGKRLALYREENRIHGRLGPLQREIAQYASAR
jgi:hypothetical protein